VSPSIASRGSTSHHRVTKGWTNMAKLTLGSVAVIVLAGTVVLVFDAGSYMVSSRLNRDAEITGNSASAPNAPGRIKAHEGSNHPTPDRAAVGLDQRSARGSAEAALAGLARVQGSQGTCSQA
jgi:hypothetical protein